MVRRCPALAGKLEWSEPLERRVYACGSHAGDQPNLSQLAAVPTVSVQVVRRNVGEGDGSSGAAAAFRVTRTGDLSEPLVAWIGLSGTAANAEDYALRGSRLVIPAGRGWEKLTITPTDDSAVEGTETVTARVKPAGTYAVGEQQFAQVHIVDDEPGSDAIVWRAGQNPPNAYAESMQALARGKWYVLGGYPASFVPVDDAYVYDPQEGTWAALPNLPQRLTHAGIAAWGPEVWMVGGYVGVSNGQVFASDKVWRFDTRTQTYSAGPSLPEARGAGAAVMVDDTLHFFGGVDARRGDQTDHWALDLMHPETGWGSLAPQPAGRNHLGAANLNGKVYAVGGDTGHDEAAVAHDDVWAYDPETDAWSAVASLPAVRSHIGNSTTVARGRLVTIGGGYAHGKAVNTVYAYDDLFDRWSTLTTLPARRFSAAAAWTGEAFLVTGGDDNGTIRGMLTGEFG